MKERPILFNPPDLGLAISVHAPWAWALMFGGKDVENRAKSFPHRRDGRELLGRVWVHASMWPEHGVLREFSRSRAMLFDESEKMVETWWESLGLLDESYDLRDLGRIRELKAVTRERTGVEVPRLPAIDVLRGHIVGSIEVHGYADSSDSPWYIPGSLAILVRDPRPLVTPVPAKGALGFWRVPEPVLEQCRRVA